MVFKRKAKASITVFFSMTIMMLMAIIMALVEVVHYTGVDKLTGVASKIGIESGFADYNRPLYEDYGILAVDTGYCGETMDIELFESRIMTYVMANVNFTDSDSAIRRNSFLRATPINVEVSDYKTLTDGGGEAFIKQAAKEALYGVPEYLIDEWSKLGNQISSENIDEKRVGELLSESKDRIANTDEGEKNSGPPVESPLSGEKAMQLEQNGNPIDTALKWKNKAVLSQVIGNVDVLSSKTVPISIPSKRVHKNAGSAGVSGTERVLFGQYLKQRFSNYKKNRAHGGLDYEWEYLICGRESDIANLEGVVTRLIAMREAENMATIMSDPGMQSEALSIATAICAAIAMPALIEPVKLGVIAAWAYLESVLDVRLILAGGKVPLVKTAAEWTSNILLFPNYVSTSVMARDTGRGMDYEDYLAAMTFLIPTAKLGIRALDVTETSIRDKEDYASVRMENFIYKAHIDFSYGANPAFAALTPITSGIIESYSFSKEEELSYM